MHSLPITAFIFSVAMTVSPAEGVTCDKFKSLLPSTLNFDPVGPVPAGKDRSWQITNFEDVSAVITCRNTGQFSGYYIQDNLAEKADHRISAIHIGFLAVAGIRAYTEWPMQRAQKAFAHLVEELERDAKNKRRNLIPNGLATADLSLSDHTTARASIVMSGPIFSIESDE